MANPQKENGHTSIANEIVEALAKINLTSYESRILWALFRKTYGWNKKNDAISLNQFSSLTNIPSQHIARTIKQLKERNLLLVSKNQSSNHYQFQKNYEIWDKFIDTTTPLGTTNSGTTPLGTTNQGTTCDVCQVLPNQVLEVLPSEVVTKDMKDTIQKKYSISGGNVTETIPVTLSNGGFAKRKDNQESIDLPDWLNKEMWDAYLEMRKKIKSIPTGYAIKLILEKLVKFKNDGVDPNEILKQSIMNNYKGVFPLKDNIIKDTKSADYQATHRLW